MNIYQPLLTTVTEVVDETADTRTLRLEFQDEAVRRDFAFKAGQFGEYSVFGAGESTFCIASSPTREGYIECSFKAIGKVTTELREVNIGDTVGFRGPYGNWFPVDDWKGKDIVFIAGGIGLAPVRCVIWKCSPMSITKLSCSIRAVQANCNGTSSSWCVRPGSIVSCNWMNSSTLRRTLPSGCRVWTPTCVI